MDLAARARIGRLQIVFLENAVLTNGFTPRRREKFASKRNDL
jgi:hypothetical protein